MHNLPPNWELLFKIFHMPLFFIDQADRVFAFALFGAEPELHGTWVKFDPHPLQMQEPGSDRHWIQTYPILQKMAAFEKQIGIQFTHIRLLARAMSDRSLALSNLTMGSNQRMEFLGDTVLQLVTSDYLYKHFPEHHEGHLSLLRSSIVNNRTQVSVDYFQSTRKRRTLGIPPH